MLALSALSAAFSAPQTPFDAYLERPEPDFAWRDTGVNITGPLLFGGVARILNVTSQRWLDESRAIGPNGALWTHQVAVVVPKVLRLTTAAISVMTGGCNEGGPDGPAPPDASDEYLVVAANLASRTGAIAVVIYQIPNCHMVYPSDPTKAHRSEDAMIAWAWRQARAAQLGAQFGAQF